MFDTFMGSSSHLALFNFPPLVVDVPLPTLVVISDRFAFVMLRFVSLNSGKNPGTLHAEGESLGTLNREGVSLCFFCSCGTKNDGLDEGTSHMCIRVGVICAAHEACGAVSLGHGQGCGRGDGEGGGEQRGGEEHENESEDGGEEKGGFGEHVGFGFWGWW